MKPPSMAVLLYKRTELFRSSDIFETGFKVSQMLNPIHWDSKYRFCILQKVKSSLQVFGARRETREIKTWKITPDHVPGRFVEADEVHGLMDIEEL